MQGERASPILCDAVVQQVILNLLLQVGRKIEAKQDQIALRAPATREAEFFPSISERRKGCSSGCCFVFDKQSEACHMRQATVLHILSGTLVCPEEAACILTKLRPEEWRYIEHGREPLVCISGRSRTKVTCSKKAVVPMLAL